MNSKDGQPQKTLNVNKIVLDKDFYPRSGRDMKHVELFVESMKAGNIFPSIVVQRIMDDGEEKIILIDGLHRLEAYKELSVDSVEVRYWKDEVLDKKEHFEEIWREAIHANLKHGKPYTLVEKRSHCIARAKEDNLILITEKMFAEVFGVSQPTVNRWVQETRARQRGSRDCQIFRLAFAGWSQTEIGRNLGLSQNRVSEIIGKITEYKTDTFGSTPESVSEFAELNALDIPVAWAMVLKDEKDDRVRIDRFNEELVDDNESYQPVAVDSWSFTENDRRLGTNHNESGISGQVVIRYLKSFTKQGEIVLDPMADGMVLDACIVMNRRCRAYDKDPIDGRIDIEKRDILDGISKKYNHIFVDPSRQLPTDVLEFNDFMITIAGNFYSALKSGGTVAIVMSDSREGGFVPLTNKCCKIFEDVGFKWIDRIVCLLPVSTVDEFKDAKAIDGNRLLVLNRYLLVFQKEEVAK